MKIPNLLGNIVSGTTTVVIKISWDFQCTRKSKISGTQEMHSIPLVPNNFEPNDK